ncbi:type IIL restriction-modification enzyme MmeI [Streptococcus iniae]
MDRLKKGLKKLNLDNNTTCNFKEFYIYDMEQPNSEAIVIKLADLEKEYYRLEFLVDKDNEHLEREMQISIKAGEIVGDIYNGLIKQYINPESPETDVKSSF